jgi:hypothetical protein
MYTCSVVTNEPIELGEKPVKSHNFRNITDHSIGKI